MAKNNRHLTEEDKELIEHYMALPDDERRFFRLLLRIGAAHVLSDEDYSFFMCYLRRQDMKRLKTIAELKKLSKKEGS